MGGDVLGASGDSGNILRGISVVNPSSMRALAFGILRPEYDAAVEGCIAWWWRRMPSVKRCTGAGRDARCFKGSIQVAHRLCAQPQLRRLEPVAGWLYTAPGA
jgi:hypothetical protein